MCCFCHAQLFEITRAKKIKSTLVQRSCQNAKEEAPEGYLTMYQTMRRLGVSRQTVWQRVKRGDIEAIHVRRGRKKGLRLKLNCSQPDLFNQAS
jgi:hypothetical protein